ncbi:MAG: cytochrome c oxidase assembly protein [Pseudomonadales bacterium]|nr:cytochrome c oxidase assembly protein [Pseudomonadales bacterium]
MLEWFLPYRFSWLAVTFFPLVAFLYAAGMLAVRQRGGHVGIARPLAFFVGLLLCYIVLHTRFDYYGQYLFFMHRAQHLVLHHVGAMLMALGDPVLFWGAAIAKSGLRLPRGVTAVLRFPVAVLQHPVIGSFVFVGIIYFWLTPSIHFDAMLSHPLYLLMNWSMFIDGLLFWLVIVDRRDPLVSGLPRHGTRLAMILGTLVPQIVLGAYITFSRSDIYDVYSVCGRAFPILPENDQLYGGLLTWIPPAMMMLLAALIVLSMIMKASREESGEIQAGTASP